MKSIVIKKWVEPYKLLETIKKLYECKDYTFDGKNKTEQKRLFFEELTKNKNSIGLYMKNVNKFYLFLRDDYIDIVEKLADEFSFTEEDLEYSEDLSTVFEKTDLGKAQAELIIP